MATKEETSEFWETLVSLSKERGLSLSKLARLADINRQGMEKWKRDSSPNLETRQRLAEALGVPLSRLTGEKQRSPYASLRRWMDAHPDVEDDVADYLWQQSFVFGDPGESTWDLLAATFKTARAQATRRK